MRAEAALETLEATCGAAINNDELFRRDLGDAVAGPCGPQQPCGEGYVCDVGTCRRDLVSVVESQAVHSADADRLAECLGSDTIVPFVALGSDVLCLWHDAGNPVRLCEGGLQSEPCPYLAERSEDEPSEFVCGRTPPGKVEVKVDSRLGLFLSDGHTLGGEKPSCNDLRLIRATPNPRADIAARQALDRLIATNYFDPEHVRSLARRLNWDPRIGGFSAVTADGI
jgi:hypothetical protein